MLNTDTIVTGKGIMIVDSIIPKSTPRPRKGILRKSVCDYRAGQRRAQNGQDRDDQGVPRVQRRVKRGMREYVQVIVPFPRVRMNCGGNPSCV